MVTTLKEAVAKNSKVESGCRIWTGSVTSRGRPVATYQSEVGTITVDVQRYLICKKHNLPHDKRVAIITTCGNPHCITSNHLQLAKIRKPRTKQVVRFDAKKCDVELNKQVFSLAVKCKKQDIQNETGLSPFLVNSILANKAMLPYFQIKLEEHLGAEVFESLQGADLTDRTLMEKYKLSRFAVDFIKSDVNFKIKDINEYLLLLSQCYVIGDHLVWNGKEVNGSPVAPLENGALRSAKKMFVYSVTGKLPEHELECNCGFNNCINPWHLE